MPQASAFPPPQTRTSSQGFRPHGHRDWFLACTRLEWPLLSALLQHEPVVRACARACRPPSIVAFRMLDRLTQQKLMHSVYNPLAPCPATTPLRTPLADTNYIRTVHGPRRGSLHGSLRNATHNTCQKEPQRSTQAKVLSHQVPLTVGPRSVPTSSHMGAWRGPTIFN